VPEQELDATQVDAGFEQMRRKGVPQQMRINSLGQLGGTPGFFAHEGDTVAGDGLGDAVARKEPGLELIELPVASQQRQQIGRKPDHAITFPLALAHLDDHAFRVDVSAPELTELGDPQAGRREGGQDRAMLEVVWSEQQRLDLVATEDDRELLGLFGVWDIVHHPGTAQGGLVEKASGTHGLDEDALGGLGMEQMELRGADVLGSQAIRGGAKVLGELGDVAQRAIDRVGRVVADLHVFKHTST
jgi:hypothetical protein